MLVYIPCVTGGDIGAVFCYIQDLMREMEGHTNQFYALHCHAEQLSSRYKPSDHLEGMMVSMQERWVEFVGTMEHHSGEKQAVGGVREGSEGSAWVDDTGGQQVLKRSDRERRERY